jgi:two-component system copper resistance phosphate regulon response regulator CusR
MKILLVDDDPRLRDTLRRGLEHAGHEAVAAASADEAEAVLATQRFDLLLLDVMMPGRDGWELLEALRARGLDVPVIFLTARDAVEERVRGLSAGADDYLTKPFALEELVARIAAVTRRRSATTALVHGALKLDPQRRVAHFDGQRVELSPREFDLLSALARAGGRPLSRRELLAEVWGIEFEPQTNTIEVHIARLRRRLGTRGKNLVRTEVGKGYSLAFLEEVK